MDIDDTLLDEKARRTRDLLASFYSPIPSASSNNPFSKHISPDDINSSSFQPDQYMKIMVPVVILSVFRDCMTLYCRLRWRMWLWSVDIKTIALKARKSNLEGLLQKHVEMVAEIKNLDTDLQMLVYENYNKFICATDTIKRYCLFYTLLWCYFSVKFCYVTCNFHRYTVMWKIVLFSHVHLAIYMCACDFFVNVRFTFEKRRSE